MAKLIVFGTSQWASLAHFYFKHDSEHEVIAFTVDSSFLSGDTFEGLPVVAFETVEQHYLPDAHKMFLPISFKRMNHLRADRYAQAKGKGYELVSYVSSRATTFADFNCGDNCFILEDNTIQPFVRIGNNVVMWSGNHIGHHSVIGDHVMITSHVVISGCCRIEPYAFFGVNATVRDETVVAPETLVGMGVTIAKDTQEFEVYRAPTVEPVVLRRRSRAVRSDELRTLSHKSKG